MNSNWQGEVPTAEVMQRAKLSFIMTELCCTILRRLGACSKNRWQPLSSSRYYIVEGRRPRGRWEDKKQGYWQVIRGSLFLHQLQGLIRDVERPSHVYSDSTRQFGIMCEGNECQTWREKKVTSTRRRSFGTQLPTVTVADRANEVLISFSQNYAGHALQTLTAWEPSF